MRGADSLPAPPTPNHSNGTRRRMTDGPSSKSELTWTTSMYDCLLNQSQQQDVGKCLSMHKFDSINMFRITTPYLRSNQLRSVGFLVGFLAGGKLLSSLQSSKPRHSRQLSEDNVPHSGQQGGSSHVKYFRIL